MRLESLTGLRFIAALLIFFHHVWGAVQYPAFAGWWPSLESWHVGVGFFFVLSGFVLAWSRRDAELKRAFVARRIAKIYPLHLLALGVALFCLVFRGSTIDWGDSAPTFVLAQAWLPDPWRYAINGPSWSISAELFFYICFPFLAVAMAKVRRPLIVGVGVFVAMIVIAALIVTFTEPETADYLLYTFPLFRIGEFALGVLLAVAMRRGWRPPVSLAWASVLCLVFVAATTAIGTVFGVELPRGFSVVLFMPFALVVIAAAASHDMRGVRGWLSSKPMVALGNWSFAFYLLHLSVLVFFRPFAHGVLTSMAAVGASLVVTVVLSWLVHRLFERPIELALRARIRRWEGQRVGTRREPRHLADEAVVQNHD